MCGRTRCTLRADDIPRACGINNGSVRSQHMDRYRPRYNVAPGSYLPVVRKETGNNNDGGQQGGSGAAVVECMKWGLIPSFTKKTEKPDHYRMFNARSESIYEKASFRRLIPSNRCLVLVDGFYEWKKDGSKKQPYYIHFKNGQPLVFAALYDSWGNSDGETLCTFTILTTSSSSALQWLHDRMPVILGNQNSIDSWLTGSSSSKFSTILKPYEDSDLVWYPVTPAMGKPSFDGPECIVEIPLKGEEKNQISNFFAKKRINHEENKSSLQSKSSSKEFIDEDPHENEDPCEGLKEEERTSKLGTGLKEENLDFKETSELGTGVKEQNLDSKFGNSPLTHREAEKRGMKREYEELTPELKALCKNIEKKQSNLKNAGKNQATLLSYFGKK